MGRLTQHVQTKPYWFFYGFSLGVAHHPIDGNVFFFEPMQRSRWGQPTWRDGDGETDAGRNLMLFCHGPKIGENEDFTKQTWWIHGDFWDFCGDLWDLMGFNGI